VTHNQHSNTKVNDINTKFLQTTYRPNSCRPRKYRQKCVNIILLKNSFLPVNSYEYDELTKIFPRFNLYSPLSRSKTPTYPCIIFYFWLTKVLTSDGSQISLTCIRNICSHINHITNILITTNRIYTGSTESLLSMIFTYYHHISTTR
jgi:hypothetical protein